MIAEMRALLAALGRKVGLHRLGAILIVAVIAVALTVLVSIVRDVPFAEVIAAIRALSTRQLGLALACVLGALVTLTCYDFFALRHAGYSKVPYGIAALAAISSFTIGHNVGGMVFVSAAVRYRIYSRHGLTVADVAKICFLTGLTFWLGNGVLLSLCIAYVPEQAAQFDQLPAAVNRAVAILALACIAAYVAWVWWKPRPLGPESWRLKLPNGPLTLIQIALGAVDLTLCALAMYFLLPPEPPIAIASFLVVFVIATLLGFASHAPGGIGVFDATVLLVLAQFEKSELLASILMFRLCYYIVPFGCSLIALGIRELAIHLPRRRGANRE